MRAGSVESWTHFSERVASRLEAGRREYGDRSFSKEPKAILAEVEQELFDVCGWSFILWCRLQTMSAALDGMPANDEGAT
jgi:hypothetical protein